MPINVFLVNNNILSSRVQFPHSHTFQHSQEHKMLAVPDWEFLIAFSLVAFLLGNQNKKNIKKSGVWGAKPLFIEHLLCAGTMLCAGGRI